MDYWMLIAVFGITVALAYERDLRCKKLSYDAPLYNGFQQGFNV